MATFLTDPPAAPTVPPAADDALSAYRRVRALSERICRDLQPEDCVVQTMPEVSPTKWHLAHTSWFFETFVLKRAQPGYTPVDPRYAFLFNSYYNAAGKMHCRPKRGLISRPTLRETLAYRREIDERMESVFSSGAAEREDLPSIITLGLHHEQQHQELMLTDIKHVFSENPLQPTFHERAASENAEPVPPLRWETFPAGVCEVGHAGEGFSYDNEGPRHRQFLEGFSLATRLSTNGEYLAFMADRGYERPEFWLSLGWSTVREQGWQAPLYWEERDGRWLQFTLNGARPVNEAEPVCHLSFFEADAFARWSAARLPTEFEWEVAARDLPRRGNFVETERFHPAPLTPSVAGSAAGLAQAYGDVWEWTRSSYDPYPGYAAVEGALGEYNGKFMCNQYVLRGGSCATSETHIRPTYRNFFPPGARWQFTGVRLARNVR